MLFKNNGPAITTSIFLQLPNNSPAITTSGFLQIPNDDSAFKQIFVPNDLPAITTSSFMQLCVPTGGQQAHDNSLSRHFKTIRFYHPTKMLANYELYPSLLCPIPLTNRVNHDGQTSMANVTTRCILLLPISNGTAITMVTPNLLLFLVQEEGSQQVIPFTICN